MRLVPQNQEQAQIYSVKLFYKIRRAFKKKIFKHILSIDNPTKKKTKKTF